MALKLDLTTIVVLTAITAFLMGVGMIVASTTHTSQERPLRHWGYSCLLQGTGWVLIGSRGIAPDWLSIAVGNTAILFSSLCYLASIDNFILGRRRPVRPPGPDWTRRALWVIGVGFCPILLLLISQFPGRSLPIRIIIISGSIAYITALCARRLLGHKPVPASRRIMGLAFVVVSLSQIGRLISTALRPPYTPELYNNTPVDSTTFLVGFVAVVMLTFFFTLMVNEQTAQELRHLATHDSLTKTFNRSAFEGYARHAIEQSLRRGDDLSLLLFDIDHFKSINDTHGHQAGDVALRQMAKLANKCLRSQDIFGRYGGEEFAVLLPSTDPEGAYMVAERIRRSIEESEFHDEGTDFRLTISGGVALLQHSGQQSTEKRLSALFRAADEALYEAKRSGRNRTLLAASTSNAAPLPPKPRQRPDRRL
jgi:diguanylate cyclase (GGDEF)-like protein